MQALRQYRQRRTQEECTKIAIITTINLSSHSTHFNLTQEAQCSPFQRREADQLSILLRCWFNLICQCNTTRLLEAILLLVLPSKSVLADNQVLLVPMLPISSRSTKDQHRGIQWQRKAVLIMVQQPMLEIMEPHRPQAYLKCPSKSFSKAKCPRSSYNNSSN